MILKKGLRFSSDKIVIAESLSRRLITQIDEDAEIVTVPDGAKLIDDDTDLKMKTIRKYGSKLCVCGDVSINDGDALAALEFLYSDGRITVSKELEDAFDEIDSIYDELKIIDPDMGFIADRPIVKIGRAVLAKYPKGVSVEDCAKVSISADLSPEEIMDKVRISDCALICCSKEQEEAVNIIAEDVAKIDTSDDSSKDRDGVLGILGEVFGNIKDTQIINSAEYKM